ncbi:4'-phosphopantetheinyl transferase superfamily protein [Larkinella ripae]
MMSETARLDIGELGHSIDWQPFTSCPVRPVRTVVRLPLAQFDAEMPRLQAFLSDEEKARGARFVQPTDRARFVIGRGMLRFFLARFTEQTPGAIAFEPGIGKPRLRNNSGPAFNLSHSGNWIVYAFDAATVGIDVEYADGRQNYTDVIRYHFSPDEQQFIARYGPDRFFTLWTRKEAWVKATGHGVDDKLSAVPSLAGFHSLATKPGDLGQHWLVRSFLCSDHYPAALAYQGQNDNPPISFYEAEAAILN